MRRLRRYFLLFRIFMQGGGYGRAVFLKKKGYFKAIGEHCYLQPWNFGTEPHMISIGDNVHIASGVTFVNHDITCMMFNYMDRQHKYRERFGEIKIGDNVFIGSNSTILYDVAISNNVIIGAGSVVTRDIPNNCIAAGIPCKVIGNFENYRKKYVVSNS